MQRDSPAVACLRKTEKDNPQITQIAQMNGDRFAKLSFTPGFSLVMECLASIGKPFKRFHVLVATDHLAEPGVNEAAVVQRFAGISKFAPQIESALPSLNLRNLRNLRTVSAFPMN